MSNPADEFDDREREVMRLYERLSGPLHTCLVVMYGLDRTKDVAEETFLRLYDALKGGPIADPKTWVWSVARQIMAERLRHPDLSPGDRDDDPAERRRRLSRTCDAGLTYGRLFEVVLFLSEHRREVRAALQGLKTNELRCLVAFARGVRLREVAAVEGMTLLECQDAVGRGLDIIQSLMYSPYRSTHAGSFGLSRR